jgi:hypothetical protein
MEALLVMRWSGGSGGHSGHGQPQQVLHQGDRGQAAEV